MIFFTELFILLTTTKDNLGMTVRPVVDRAKDLNGQNQCNSKESFACGEDWFHYTGE